MAHLTDGTLRRMVDDPDVPRAERAHLDDCAECQARFHNIAADGRSIATLLAVPDANVDVASAYRRVTSASATRPPFGFRLPVLSPAPRVRLAFVAAAAAVAVALVAFVYNGLVYQPSTVKPVPVTVADIQALSQLADYGTLTWTKQANFQVATTAADASAVANGLAVPSAKNIPSKISTNITYVGMADATAIFTFSATKAAAAAASHGKTPPTMPAGMDGATLTVTVGPAVGEIYGDMNKQGSSPSDISLPQLVVARSAAPKATSTQVSAQQLEDFILQQPGISTDLANAIKAIGDPTKVLPIPVPVQLGTPTQVTINGADGVALGDNTGVGAGVVWIGKDGYVYVVAGSIKQSEALDIAKTL